MDEICQLILLLNLYRAHYTFGTIYGPYCTLLANFICRSQTDIEYLNTHTKMILNKLILMIWPYSSLLLFLHNTLFQWKCIAWDILFTTFEIHTCYERYLIRPSHKIIFTFLFCYFVLVGINYHLSLLVWHFYNLVLKISISNFNLVPLKRTKMKLSKFHRNLT